MGATSRSPPRSGVIMEKCWWWTPTGSRTPNQAPPPPHQIAFSFFFGGGGGEGGPGRMRERVSARRFQHDACEKWSKPQGGVHVRWGRGGFNESERGWAREQRMADTGCTVRPGARGLPSPKKQTNNNTTTGSTHRANRAVMRLLRAAPRSLKPSVGHQIAPVSTWQGQAPRRSSHGGMGQTATMSGIPSRMPVSQR